MPIVTLAGHQRAGKTTLGKKLRDRLRYGYSYTGGIFRDMAERHGQTIEEFYEYMEANPEMEREIDNQQAEMMRTHDHYIFEGRMAPFLLSPFHRVNILLTVDRDEAYRRQHALPEYNHLSLEEVKRGMDNRLESECRRYDALYGIKNHFDPDRFHIIIDTSGIKPPEVLESVMLELFKRGVMPLPL